MTGDPSTLALLILAFLASGLTLFSSFGLGTMLLPAFLIFFPPELAIAMTAIVHFLNNIFKLFLLGRNADLGIVVRFGLPAIIAAFAGAGVLMVVSHAPSLASYELFGKAFQIVPVKVIVAILMIGFATMEVLPSMQRMGFDRKYLPLGGLLSGFFGGLSGHQGALRSAFLVRAGLSREVFIATGVVIACLIDVTRLSVYAEHFASTGLQQNASLIVATTLSAFTGAFVGNKLVRKVTMRGIQRIVSFFLLVIALALGSGLI